MPAPRGPGMLSSGKRPVWLRFLLHRVRQSPFCARENQTMNTIPTHTTPTNPKSQHSTCLPSSGEGIPSPVWSAADPCRPLGSAFCPAPARRLCSSSAAILKSSFLAMATFGLLAGTACWAQEEVVAAPVVEKEAAQLLWLDSMSAALAKAKAEDKYSGRFHRDGLVLRLHLPAHQNPGSAGVYRTSQEPLCDAGA